MKISLSKEMWVKIGLAIAVALGVPINFIFLADEPDNALEQVDELLIKDLTGVDIDLSQNNKKPQ